MTLPMDIERINPELRGIYRWMPHLPFHKRWFLGAYRAGMRLLRPKSAPGGVALESRATSAGPAYLCRPEESTGAALLWIHGGGLICGSPLQNQAECVAYAQQLGIVVAAVSYRMAPEHPFPAALDDCHEAWCWLQSIAGELGIDPARVVIAGQSAGGGLSASLAQRLADEGGIQPAAQVLLCPMLDDRTGGRTDLDAVRHKMWNNRSNRAGWSWYLGHAAGGPESRPYAVPGRRADLSGLPPAWIGIGDADLFYDESVDYRDRLMAAGVRCDWHRAPGGFHGFEVVARDTAVSRAFWEDQYRFLRDVLQLNG